METSDDRNITVVLTIRTNVEYQIKLTSKLQNARYHQQKPCWCVEAGGVACESSSLSVANTANVEASSTKYCRCYSSKRGNVHEKNYFYFFLNNIPSIIVVVSNQNKTMKMHTGPYGARTFGIIIL